MAKRKGLGKRTRFEIFKRDGFTCQYCGVQPPEAILVCDHITPVALGGTNDLANLITACESCNQGKSDKPLGYVQPRPDADLMYLETQQEIGELRRFQQCEQAKREALDGVIESIRSRFLDLVDINWAPHPKVLRQMLNKYSPELVNQAVEALAYKVSRTENLQSLAWAPYTWAVLRRLQEQDEDDCFIAFRDLETDEQQLFCCIVADILLGKPSFDVMFTDSSQRLRMKHEIAAFLYDKSGDVKSNGLIAVIEEIRNLFRGEV